MTISLRAGSLQKTTLLALLLFTSVLIVSGLKLSLTHAAATPTFVQTNFKEVSSGKTDAVAFTKANTAGNLIVVYAIWSNTGSFSLADTRGNSYTAAAPVTNWNGTAFSSQVFYAKNIPAGANTVTATFGTTISGFGIVYVHEYSGMDKTNPVDVAKAATGASGSAMSSGSINTTNSNDLIFGAGASSATVNKVGTGYTTRSKGANNMTEDKLVTTTGSYSTTESHNGTYWVMHLVAFKADAGTSDTTAPSVPANLIATPSSSSQINLSWSASTDNVGVTGYRVFRNGTQVGTPTGTTYQDTGLVANTSYNYTVSAVDAAGNSSAQSTVTSATTLPIVDTTAPTINISSPANGATVKGTNNITTTTSDNVGVTKVELSVDGQLVTTDTTSPFSFSLDTTTLTDSSHAISAKAYDAAGNTATSAVNVNVDNSAPSTPANVTPNVISSSQINLSWDASTDNTAVTGYKIFRGGTQVGTTALTTFQDTGLTGITNYSYTVSAFDAVGNNSTQSVSVNATTSATVDSTAPSVNITAPALGATIQGTTNVTATASDNVGVTKVELSVDNQLVSTDTASPYVFSLDTTTLTNATHAVSAKAYDAAGNTASFNINVIVSNTVVDTTAPSVPANLAASGVTASKVDLSWSASTDNVGVTKYQVFRGGVLVGSPTGTTYTDSPLTASTTYSYTVQAVDAAGNFSGAGSPLGVTTAASPPGAAYPLKVSSNGRYLVDQNNTPFLMVGDSPQSLIGNMSEAQADAYFADRQAHGFNTVWINLLCDSYTFCNSNGTTYDGIAPFTTVDDLNTPNPVYFQKVDDIINLAAAHGLNVNLDPIETGGWIGWLIDNGPTKDFNYGQYLGNRYKNFPNIIWQNGNDFWTWRTPRDDADATAVAQGIKAADPNHIHTVELDSPISTSMDDPNWAPIVSLNAAYTYYPTYAEVLHGYNQSATPVYMVEANYEYEDIAADVGTPSTLRRQEYWTMLSGGAGQLYGSLYTDRIANGWQASVIDSPAVTQLAYETALLQSKAWYNLVPDQTHAVVTAGYGTFNNNTTTTTISNNDYATTARTPDGLLAMTYMPTARTITVDMTKLSGPVTARWYDPTNGTYTGISGSPFAATGSRQFTPAAHNSAGDSDWVLVLEGVPANDTQPPTVPTNLNAVPSSPTQVNLSWTASTDDVGVTGYNVFRNDVQIGSSFSTSFSDTGLTAGTTYNYSVSAFDGSGKTSDLATPISATTPLADTQAPTTPINLQAANITPNSVTISWGASTDDLAVSGYLLYRNGVQIADTTALSAPDVNLAPSTNYQYMVAAYDTTGNISPQSLPLSVTTLAPLPVNPAFVQLKERSQTVSSNSVSTTTGFSSATKAGDTIVVWLWYNSSSQSVTTVTDTAGNVYTRAIGPTTGSGAMAAWRQEIWYAKNIGVATGLVVNAQFSGTFSTEKSISAHEYSGLDPVSPVDKAAGAAVSTGANTTSPSVTTTSAKDLIFGAILYQGNGTAGSGFTQRSFLANNATEDKVVSTIGSYNAAFTNTSQASIVQVVVFRAVGQ